MQLRFMIRLAHSMPVRAGQAALLGGLALVLGAFTLSTAVMAQPPETSPPAASTDVPAELAAFRERYAVWLRDTDKLRAAFTLFQASDKSAAHQAEFESLVEQNAKMTDELILLAEAAYAVSPNDQQIIGFLTQAATQLSGADRLDDALRIVLLLESKGFKDDSMKAGIGRLAYELGDLAMARKYFQLAADEGRLGQFDKLLLAGMDDDEKRLQAEMSKRKAESAADTLPRVKLKTTEGDIVLELFENDAPNTVANFLHLVDQGFYNGLPFFRVTAGFGAMGGCPKGNGRGGPGYELPREMEASARPHLRGTVSMVASPNGLNGSQFFIAYQTAPTRRLDATMPVFGRVISGLDVATKLRRVDPLDKSDELPPDRIIEALVIRKPKSPRVAQTLGGSSRTKVQEAVRLLEANKHQEAISILQELVKVTPDDFEANFLLGHAYLQLNDHQRAIGPLRHAAELAPNHVDVRYDLAMAYMTLEQYEPAIEEFQAVIRLNPKHLRAYNNLATVLAAIGKLEEAVEQLNAALAVDPNYEQARQNLEKLKEIIAMQK